MNDIPNYPQIAAVVYQACTNYDPYLPPLTPDLARSWGKAFAKYALGLGDLLAAVDRIYSEEIDYRLSGPARIVQTAREVRRDRAEREDEAERQACEDAFDAALAARNKPLIRGIADTIGAAKHPDNARQFTRPSADPTSLPVLKVPCTYCKASVGRPCIAKSTGRPMREEPRAHPARITAAAKHPEDTVWPVCTACHTRPLVTDADRAHTVCVPCLQASTPQPPDTEAPEENGGTA